MISTACIVGGCGHVGLPLGIALARTGVAVCLMDTDPGRVREVNEGRMPFTERGAGGALAKVLENGLLRAQASLEGLGQHPVVIVTIGTPVDEFLDPSVRSFDAAMDAILDRMQAGQLLVLRSTLFPGVTDRLARRVAERGPSIDIAYCPERIAQGYALEELTRLPQIISGITSAAVERSAELFQRLGVELVELPPIEAELAKLFANAFRYINFAIANQFFILAHRFGANFHRIHHAVTFKYPRMQGFARAGFAAGPCLLKDTMQLAAFNHNGFAIGQAAMMINEGLPRALVDMVKAQRDLSGDTATILGMGFKGDCDDPRDSLAYKLRKVLSLECRRVLCTDPYIQDPTFVSLETALKEADVVFIGACHDAYRKLDIQQPLVDIFAFVQSPASAPCPRVAA
jgi:UDP-N-acetyl-D-mannosaminuronic acid dehydrogenase